MATRWTPLWNGLLGICIKPSNRNGTPNNWSKSFAAPERRQLSRSTTCGSGCDNSRPAFVVVARYADLMKYDKAVLEPTLVQISCSGIVTEAGS